MIRLASVRWLVPLLALCIALALGACGDGDGEDSVGEGSSTEARGAEDSSRGDDDGATDITDARLTSRGPDCASYVGEYGTSVTDLGRDVDFTAAVEITANAGDCTLSSNGIPNHDFNDAGAFASPVSEVDESFTVPRLPTAARSPTALSLTFDNDVFLNGVKLDQLGAACYGVGPDPLGRERIGCMEAGTPWRYDPMFPGNGFGTDRNNAHTQPDGAYHYHGDPAALYDAPGGSASGVIGFAADGFPIYGPHVDEGGRIRRAVSGYALRAGARVSQPGESAFPGGNYDGAFIDDYEFTGEGDLDACNGMVRDGSYGYYVTDSYPWVVGCFAGTPDGSFRKGPPG